VEIITVLAFGERNVSSTTGAVRRDMPTVSRSLHCLLRHSLVEVRKLKKWRIYRLTDKVRISRRGTSLALTLEAEDGGRVTLEVPGPQALAGIAGSVDGEAVKAAVWNPQPD
jgi:hypothetical protein